MAHVAKYTAGAAGNMLAHFEHKKPRDNVNAALTSLNYNLAAEVQPLPQLDFLRQRIDGLKKRKDAIAFCDWCITKPATLPAEYADKFFKECFDFCAARYGIDNVISAFVHKDEDQHSGEHHLHFAFCPITSDGRLCAKQVVSRADLQRFHADLSKHLEAVFGFDVGVLNDAVKQQGGNKTTEQLKEKSRLQAECDAIRAECEAMTKKLRSGYEALEELQENLDASAKSLAALQGDEVQQAAGIAPGSLVHIIEDNAKKKPLRDAVQITLPQRDFDNLLKYLRGAEVVHTIAERVRSACTTMRTSLLRNVLRSQQESMEALKQSKDDLLTAKAAHKAEKDRADKLQGVLDYLADNVPGVSRFLGRLEGLQGKEDHAHDLHDK